MLRQYEEARKEGMQRYGFGIDAMKKVKVCTACGQPSPSERHFCTECGYRLPDKTLYDIYKERHKSCSACDTILSDGMEYCPQCGALVTSQTEYVFKEIRKNEKKLE